MEHHVLIVFFLVALSMTETWAGYHSMKYFDTVVTGPRLGLEEQWLMTVGYVDDKQFVRFYSDSRSQSTEPRAPWIELETPDYWERETRHLKDAHHCPMSPHSLHFHYNQSDDGGVHTLQRMYGCEVFSNGSFSTFYLRYGYDGQDKLYLDPVTLSWIASDNEALNIKLKLDADQSPAKTWKVHLKDTCVQWLLRHLEIGKNTLLRTDPPSVQVTRHISSEWEVTLKCRAWGFYPAEISLIWLRDGEEQIQDTEYIETRPGGDGTFQKWAAVGMPFANEEKYTCQIQHEGLPEPLSLKWEPRSASIGPIVGIIAVAILTAAAVGIVICKKYTSGGKGRDYALTPENDSAQGSDVSLTTRA